MRQIIISSFLILLLASNCLAQEQGNPFEVEDNQCVVFPDVNVNGWLSRVNVVQVINKNQALVRVVISPPEPLFTAGYDRSKYATPPEQDHLFMYEGSTEGWTDGKYLREFTGGLKIGTHQYRTSVGTKTVPKLKAVTFENLKAIHPDLQTLTMKTGQKINVVMARKKSSKVLVYRPSTESISEIPYRMFDKDTKGTIREWTKANEETTPAQQAMIDKFNEQKKNRKKR